MVWCRRSSQLRISARRANPTTRSPNPHCSTRHAVLPTQGLAIPSLADFCDVVGSESLTPGFAFGPPCSKSIRIVQHVQRCIRERLGRGKGEPAGSPLGDHVEHATSIPAGNDRYSGDERLRGGETEPLALGWKQHEVGLAQEIGYLLGRNRT